MNMGLSLAQNAGGERSHLVQVIAAVRCIFAAELPDSWCHPSQMRMEAFRREVRCRILHNRDLTVLRMLAQNTFSGAGLVKELANHIELQVYLEVMNSANYNVPFCGEINRFLFAYLSLVRCLRNGRGEECPLAMVRFGQEGRSNHAILLCGSSPLVLDAFEADEELQVYLLAQRPHRGTLDYVITANGLPDPVSRVGAEAVTIVRTIGPDEWSCVPEADEHVLRHMLTRSRASSLHSLRQILARRGSCLAATLDVSLPEISGSKYCSCL